MRRELGKRVRAELEARIEKQWLPVEERLMAQLSEISEDVTLKLLNEFKTLRERSSRRSGEPVQNGLFEQEKAIAVSIGFPTPGLPVADSSSTNVSEEKYLTAAPTQDMANETTTDKRATGDQAFDPFGFSLSDFEGAHWAESDIFLVEPQLVSWSSTFPIPGDIQLGAAIRPSPTSTLPIIDGGDIVMRDGTMLGTTNNY